MVSPLKIVLLFNSPVLAPDHRDYASEAGVLDSVSAIKAAAIQSGYIVHELAIGDGVAEMVEQLKTLDPHVVVNLCESFAGRPQHEAHVAAILELLGFAYTGSPPECLSLALDKPQTKRLLAGAFVPTPEFIEVARDERLDQTQIEKCLMRGPLFVKPAREDASLGIGPESVCIDFDAVMRRVEQIHRDYGDALVERYIAGREFNVGIIELPSVQTLPLAEIEFQTSTDLPWPILTYEGKWSPESNQCVATPVRTPAMVDDVLAEKIKQVALAAYKITGCCDYARVDLRVDEAGHVFVLEVNANPDLSPTAGLARMLNAAGIVYEEFVRRLIETAAQRQKPCEAKRDGERIELAIELSAQQTSSVKIRSLQTGDIPRLEEITRVTGVFRPDEIEIAAEVLTDSLRDPTKSGYAVLVAEVGGQAVGWSCHGKVPLTDATFDLYWIVVSPELQGQGIGRQLLCEAESQVATAGGRWLLAETSSTTEYESTRNFYHRCGYRVVSEIVDFYRAGDGRLTLGKRLDHSESAAK